MSNFNDIGNLIHLPIDELQFDEQTDASESAIATAAEAIKKAGGRNWIPVIVQEVENSDSQYQVVANFFIYAATQKVGLKQIWCVVIEPDATAIESAKILAKEIPAPTLTATEPIPAPVALVRPTPTRHVAVTPAPTAKMNLVELKAIASKRGITPIGDKRLKATWVTALAVA